MTEGPSGGRSRRWPRWVLAAAVVVVAALAGTVLAIRSVRARECRAWHQALAVQTARVAGTLGGQTARQFRMEAIGRGWVDEGGQRVDRPNGCGP